LRESCAKTKVLCRAKLAGGGEAAHELLLFFEEAAEFGAGGIGFDAALDIGEFFFGLAVAEGVEAAHGFVPSGLAGFFEQNFVEDSAIAVFESCGDLRGLERLVGVAGGNEGGEDFFGFEAVMELALLKLLREFLAKALGFGEHADEAALDGFGAAGH
jgi:hypothetical protein